MIDVVRQAWLIARFDLGTSLRTRRALLALLLYGLVAVGTGVAAVAIERKVREEVAAHAAQPGMEAQAAAAAEAALTFFLGGDRDLARHLLDMPLVVAGFFWVTLTFLPFLVALSSHDLVNAEVRNHSARFVLLRAPRGALLAGKVASHGLLFLGVTVASNAALLAYAWWNLPDFPVVRSGLLLARFWAFTAVYGLCCLSLAALVSSLVDSAGRSLIGLFVVVVGLHVLALNDSLGVLSPFAHKAGLWSPRVGEVAASLATLLAFAIVFLGGAYARLRGRDF